LANTINQQENNIIKPGKYHLETLMGQVNIFNPPKITKAESISAPTTQ